MDIWILAAKFSTFSIAHLWLLRSGEVVEKCVWTVVCLLPFLGPLFYFALYEPPKPQEPEFRARLSDKLQGAYGDRKHLDYSDNT